MIRIEYGVPLGDREYEKVYDLVNLSYGRDVFHYPGRARERFDRCHDCYVLAWEGETLVAAWVIYPVSHRLWQRALASDAILDDDIEAGDIRPLSRTEPNLLMIMDVVIHPDWQGQGLADRMMDALRACFRRWMSEGYEMQGMFAFTVSEGGETLAKKIGGLVRRVMCEGRALLLEFPTGRFLDPAPGEPVIHWGDRFPMELYPQMIALELAAYGREVFTHPGYVEERVRTCPDYFVWATDGERLVGAQCGFPVKPEAVDDAIARGMYLDDALRPDQLAPTPYEGVRDYVSLDILVDPAYRRDGLAHRLLDETRAMLRKKTAQGERFGRYFGYAVSAGGRRLAQSLGGRFLLELPEGAMFAADMADVLKE